MSIPDLQYPYDDLRGWLFIALWLVNLTFGLSMLARASREGGIIKWRFPGLALAGLYLFFLSGLSFQSVLNYTGLYEIDPVGTRSVVFLAVVVSVGVWTFVRWRREGLVD